MAKKTAEEIEAMRREVQAFDMERMAEVQKAREEKLKPLRDVLNSEEYKKVRDGLAAAMGADPDADIHLVNARQNFAILDRFAR